VSHPPDLTPIDFALFPRPMPAASSGASKPLSVAATILSDWPKSVLRFLTRFGLRPFLRQSGVLTLAVRC
jgi:hypothetical protein